MEARNHQVVMINEDHSTEKHRVFSEILLEPLFDLGFRYLAIETLSEKDKNLNSRKFPIKSSGTYSNEPNYANFIRTALEMGFELIPYEIRDDDEDDSGESNFITYREECQSNHLADFIKQNPKAKIFVHAGWDHIKEHTTTKWMAERFREKTGINPLTISQAHMDENPNLDKIKLHKDLSETYGIDLMLEYPKSKELKNIFYNTLKRVKIKFEGANNLNQKIYVAKEYEVFKEQAIPCFIIDKSSVAYLMPNKEYVVITSNNRKIEFSIGNVQKTIEMN